MSIVQHKPISECISATETSQTWHLPHISKGFPKGSIHLLDRLLKTVAVSIDQHNLLGFMGEPQIQRVVLVAVAVVSCNATRPEVKVDYFLLYICTSSTAQGGGGSFFYRNLKEKLVVVNHGWQSESTDGPTGGWRCVFWNGCNGCSGPLTTTAGCSVAQL